MFAVTGISGQVGGAVARNLLAAGKNVRAVVRNAQKGRHWSDQGCEVALAEMSDVEAMRKAFSGVEGVFILLPSNFDPAPDFPETRRTVEAIRTALEAAHPARVVCLSTIGAHAKQHNLLNQLGLLEQELGSLPMPTTFLRAAWFIENAAWDVAAARETGVIASYLQPLDQAVPMVATADVGRVAAELLLENWSGRRIVNVEGPHRITPNEIAAGFSTVLGRPVRAQAVPRDTWENLFRTQGMQHPLPRMQMLDGFNQGWIAFEQGETDIRKGSVRLETVLQGLVERETQ